MSESSKVPKITLYFLQESRCIRTAWQLEELKIPYEVKYSARENNAAPAAFKKEAGGLGKFPVIEDAGDFYYESGNICEYLSDNYDVQHRLLPAPADPARYRVLQWVHAAEGTFMLHGLAVTYTRWHQKSGDVKETEEGLSVNVVKDLDHLEAELNKTSDKFLFGNEVTAADIMMEFSVDYILTRELGTKGKKWPRIDQWLKNCHATESYKRAVEKTGHKL